MFHAPSQNAFKWILKQTEKISFTMLNAIFVVVLHWEENIAFLWLENCSCSQSRECWKDHTQMLQSTNQLKMFANREVKCSEFCENNLLFLLWLWKKKHQNMFSDKTNNLKLWFVQSCVNCKKVEVDTWNNFELVKTQDTENWCEMWNPCLNLTFKVLNIFINLKNLTLPGKNKCFWIKVKQSGP